MYREYSGKYIGIDHAWLKHSLLEKIRLIKINLHFRNIFKRIFSL